MAGPSVPYPLFPPLSLLNEQAQAELPINLEVRQRLQAIPEHLDALSVWQTGIAFLGKQCRSADFTERHYNALCPIIESMLHWSWSIRDKALRDWSGADAKAFIEFVMRPPMSWVATPGCSRFSRKTRQDFSAKPINTSWRPIIRKKLVGNDPGLGTRHHRDWSIVRGREFFDFYRYSKGLPDAGVVNQNPFHNIQTKDFEIRAHEPRIIFNPEQLNDLLQIAESVANRNEKWEPFLFLAAVAVYSKIPMRALGSTQTIKPTFSYFKSREPDIAHTAWGCSKTNFAVGYLASRPPPSSGPSRFESPLYPGRHFEVAPEFDDYFHRYAQFRYTREPSLSTQSFIFPLVHGADAYGTGSIIELFGNFSTSILKELNESHLAASPRWKWSEKLQPNASLAFLELRKSAQQAGMIPKASPHAKVRQDTDTWPDIGIRNEMSRSRWFNLY